MKRNITLLWATKDGFNFWNLWSSNKVPTNQDWFGGIQGVYGPDKKGEVIAHVRDNNAFYDVIIPTKDWNQRSDNYKGVSPSLKIAKRFGALAISPGGTYTTVLDRFNKVTIDSLEFATNDPVNVRLLIEWYDEKGNLSIDNRIHMIATSGADVTSVLQAEQLKVGGGYAGNGWLEAINVTASAGKILSKYPKEFPNGVKISVRNAHTTDTKNVACFVYYTE